MSQKRVTKQQQPILAVPGHIISCCLILIIAWVPVLWPSSESLDAADVDLDAVDHSGAELCEGGEHGGELRVAHVVLRHHDAKRRPPAQPPSSSCIGVSLESREGQAECFPQGRGTQLSPSFSLTRKPS